MAFARLNKRHVMLCYVISYQIHCGLMCPIIVSQGIVYQGMLEKGQYLIEEEFIFRTKTKHKDE